MTSVADIPGDADDDLPEISPELVLVDPELARIMRERQPEGGRRALVPTLRLVQPADEPAAIVPRATTVDESAAAQPEPETEVASDVAVAREDAVAVRDTATGRPPDVFPTSEPSSLVGGSVEESTALVPAVPRVVDAEPARVLEPPAAAEPAAGPSTAPAAATVLASPPDDPSSSAPPHALPAAMPHPIARPERSHRQPVRSGGRPRRRGRGVLAFIAAVAAASLATLGILNLSDGSSSAPKTTAAISGGPSTAKRSAAKPKAATSKKAAKPKTAPKPKTVAKAKTSAKPKTVAKAKTVAKKPRTVVKAKTTAKKPTIVAKNPTTKPKATTTPRETAKPKAQASTPVPKPASKPKPQQTKPAAAEPRRFAWAPVEGAVSYHVELFRGADRVLVKETTEPILELASTWRYEGKTVELTPGSYRWYVWPVTKSGRATQAVVQAKLDVP
jgi:hypothetical protein